jgi:thiamine-phosphate pyrophosphorylase
MVAIPFSLPPIYPITDKRLARKTSHLAIVKELVRAGARLVQIRDKETPVRELLADLLRCVDFAHSRNVTVIVDDRCDLVMLSGADGVHLGRQDLPPQAARTVLGHDRLIGYSTHSLQQVRRSNGLPVQYIGFGPVYPSSTKNQPDPVTGLHGLRRACRASVHPVVAIGGIGLDQVPEVLAAGASSVAVISALMSSKNLSLRMEAFLRAATAK